MWTHKVMVDANALVEVCRGFVQVLSTFDDVFLHLFGGRFTFGARFPQVSPRSNASYFKYATAHSSSSQGHLKLSCDMSLKGRSKAVTISFPGHAKVLQVACHLQGCVKDTAGHL